MKVSVEELVVVGTCCFVTLAGYLHLFGYLDIGSRSRIEIRDERWKLNMNERLIMIDDVLFVLVRKSSFEVPVSLCVCFESIVC